MNQNGPGRVPRGPLNPSGGGLGCSTQSRVRMEVDSGSSIEIGEEAVDREISLGTLGPTGWRGVSEVLSPLALRISFCLFFLSSPYPSALIPLSYLSFPLLPSSSPSIFPCWLLNPLSYSSFLAFPLHSPSSTSPVPHRYPLLFLTLHLLLASPHLFASLMPSISHSPASSPTLFFSYPSSTTISPPPTPYSLLPSLSSCPTPLYC